jgi:hypothetical protein
MIIAPDVFTIDQGAYTPEIAVDWFNDPRLGKPTPLFVGRTLRYSNDNGWEVAGTTATAAWKSMEQAPKTVKSAFEEADTDGVAEGYYELIGPKVAGNPHGLKSPAVVRHGGVAFGAPIDDIPRTSLYAWPAWLKKHKAQGVLWIDDSTEETRYAVVSAEYMPKA